MDDTDFYDADAVEIDDTISCKFKLNGYEWSCRNRDQVDLRIIGTVLDNGLVNVEDFFSKILIPEDREDFVALLRSDDFPLEMKKTQGLMEFLTEKILNRPTVRPAPSGRGSRPTSHTSEEVSSSRVTPRRRSAG